MFIFKHRLRRQLLDYINYKSNRFPISSTIDKPILERFCSFVKASDVSQITPEDILNYSAYIKKQLVSNYFEQASIRAVRGFLRYYHKRGYMCPNPSVTKLIHL